MKSFLLKSHVIIMFLCFCTHLGACDHSKIAVTSFEKTQEVAERSGSDHIERMAQLQQMAESEASRADRVEQVALRLEQRADMLEEKATVLEKALKALKALPDTNAESKYSRALKISTIIGGGIFTLGGGLLAYRYDVYGIGTMIGSYGSWWQGIKNWLGIRRIEQTQSEHTTMLKGHGEQLGRVEEEQKAQGQAVTHLGTQVEQVITAQAEHGRTLENHTGILEKFNGEQQRQGKTLAEIVQNIFRVQTTLNGHGTQLTTIQATLNTVRDMRDGVPAQVAEQLRPIQQQMSAMQGDLNYMRTFVEQVSQPRIHGFRPAHAPHLFPTTGGILNPLSIGLGLGRGSVMRAPFAVGRQLEYTKLSEV